jgi:iron complex outermembrane recepter protein
MRATGLKRLTAIATTLALLLGASVAGAQQRVTALLELSIEELADVRVTTAARRSELLVETASAVFVLTRDDIVRIGATTLPELLRHVPGVHVAQLDGHRWAISMRGFLGEFANKLLVLIDGRSVYTPVHGGVNWILQDTMLEDIDRIEVVRGPGASLWGANAVNGVINIVTRAAHDTHGGLVVAGAGNQQRMGAVRWGGQLGEHGSVRGYLKGIDSDRSYAAAGGRAHDAWWQARAGFRADWNPNRDTQWTLQGAAFDGEVERVFPITSLTPPLLTQVPFENRTRGAYLMGRLTRNLDVDEGWSLQSYFDWARASPLVVQEDVLTWDVEFERRMRAGGHHQLVWGLGYRQIRDRFDDTFIVSFRPARRTVAVWSAFVQDTIALRDDVELTLGAKLEHNAYSGLELQPTGRLLWRVSPSHTLWGAVSRAVRTPSRAEADIEINLVAPGPVVQRVLGSRRIDAEALWAYELGYRYVPRPSLYIDGAIFHHEYDGLLSRRLLPPFDAPGPPPHRVAPDVITNGVHGHSRGLELAARWYARPSWRLDLGYSLVRLDLEAEPGLIPAATAAERSTPRHLFTLGSHLLLPWQLEFDTYLTRASAMPSRNLDAFTRLDLRLGRDFGDLSVELLGRNVLDRHSEFEAGTELPRAVQLRFRWQF